MGRKQLSGVDGWSLLVSQVQADRSPELGGRSGHPVVLSEESGGRVVDRDSAVEVSLAVFLSDLLRVLELRHPVVQDPGRVPVQVHHKVAGVLFLSFSFLVVEMSLCMNDEASVRGEVGGCSTVGKSESCEETDTHREHCDDVESRDQLHGILDDHGKRAEV